VPGSKTETEAEAAATGTATTAAAPPVPAQVPQQRLPEREITAGHSGAAPGPGRNPRSWQTLVRWLLGRPPERTVQAACFGALVANTLIVVTGGAVRLTDSGLGCPTWPECTAGSLVPVPSLGYHALIEFSNRLLTYAVCVAVGAAIVASMRQRPRRPMLVKLSWVLFAGVALQAVIGGIAVRTDLAPAVVAVHFCVSIGMIAISWMLWTRSREGDGPAALLVRRELAWLSRLLAAATGAVIVVGTMVTGTGPHSGSADATKRLPFNPVDITQAHADLVFIVVGLTVALWFALRAVDARPAAVRAVRDMFVVLVIQAAIGYTQYFTGLPAWLVLFHMAGACLTWAAAWRVMTSLRERPRAAQA
jgi:cytochrome c oxidase assembly protein subunit 15